MLYSYHFYVSFTFTISFLIQVVTTTHRRLVTWSHSFYFYAVYIFYTSTFVLYSLRSVHLRWKKYYKVCFRWCIQIHWRRKRMEGKARRFTFLLYLFPNFIKNLSISTIFNCLSISIAFSCPSNFPLFTISTFVYCQLYNPKNYLVH